jgi:tetratricopeptide (TPR) repeat protein
VTHEAAALAYAEGERLWRAGQPEAALVCLLRAVALRPDHPNAQNFAGWLLTTRHGHEPAALAQGVALLEGAHALAPDHARPLYNLCEALVTAGRREAALARADAAVTGNPAWAQAYNLRGWVRGLADGADDPAGARADLERAVALWPGYGDAWFNLGRLSLRTGEDEAARAALGRAVACENCWRAAEAHLRLGILEQRLGRLRVALGLYRRAVELDGAGEHAQALHAGVQGCGAALLQTGRYLLHALDETRRAATPSPPRPPRLSRLAARARAAMAGADAATTAALQTVAHCCELRALAPAYADQSPTLALELAAATSAGERAAELRALAEDWAAAQRSLYDELLAAEEPDPAEAATPVGRVEALAAARQWEAALAGLQALPVADEAALLDRAVRATRYGDRARRDDDEPAARALYEQALADHEAYACRSSGEEAHFRRQDALPVEQRLRE